MVRYHTQGLLDLAPRTDLLKSRLGSAGVSVLSPESATVNRYPMGTRQKRLLHNGGHLELFCRCTNRWRTSSCLSTLASVASVFFSNAAGRSILKVGLMFWIGSLASIVHSASNLIPMTVRICVPPRRRCQVGMVAAQAIVARPPVASFSKLLKRVFASWLVCTTTVSHGRFSSLAYSNRWLLGGCVGLPHLYLPQGLLLWHPCTCAACTKSCARSPKSPHHLQPSPPHTPPT